MNRLRGPASGGAFEDAAFELRRCRESFPRHNSVVDSPTSDLLLQIKTHN